MIEFAVLHHTLGTVNRSRYLLNIINDKRIVAVYSSPLGLPQIGRKGSLEYFFSFVVSLGTFPGKFLVLYSDLVLHCLGDVLAQVSP